MYSQGRSKPKRTGLIIGLVILIVFVVIVSVFAAMAILYSLSSGILPPESTPVIAFSSPVESGDSSNYTTSWHVSNAGEPILGFNSFEFSVWRDGTPLAGRIDLSADRKVSVGSNVKLIVQDMADDGKLNTGDTFMIYGMTGTHTWGFQLYYGSKVSPIATVTWNTP